MRLGDIGNSRMSPWMCVWQSQASGGTSKFTGVAGCDAFASAKRGASVEATAAMISWRREGMCTSLELVAAQAAVDGNDGAGDVARARRREEADEVGDVLGLTIFADRNVLAAFALAEFGRVVAQDLLGDDAAGRHAVHGDAVSSHVAREALGPRMHRRLGGEGAVQPLGLGLAGDVDDAAPVALNHLRQQTMGELAMAAEVERQRFLPLLVGRFEREAAAAARVVDQDVDAAQFPERGFGDAPRSVGREEVLLDDDELARLLFQLLEEMAAPGSDGEPNAFLRQRQRDRAADAHARPGDERAFAGDAKFHLPNLGRR